MPWCGEKAIIGTVVIEDYDGSACTARFTAKGEDGVAGSFKAKMGSEPLDFEAGYSTLYPGADGKWYVQDANGDSREVVLAEGEQ